MNAYDALLSYYRQCFSEIDYFHFNSRVSASVYEDRCQNIIGRVVPITNFGIKDNRIKKDFMHSELRIGFIGNLAPYKGYLYLLDVLKCIKMDSANWNLTVWGGQSSKEPYLPIFFKGKYSSATLCRVYSDMDVLVVPSIWKETFGFVVLEALSYGTPVIVSDNVGAKDIVKEYDSGFIYHTRAELKHLLEMLIIDRTLLRNFNQRILALPWRHDMLSHANEIVDKIYNH